MVGWGAVVGWAAGADVGAGAQAARIAAPEARLVNFRKSRLEILFAVFIPFLLKKPSNRLDLLAITAQTVQHAPKLQESLLSTWICLSFTRLFKTNKPTFIGLLVYAHQSTVLRSLDAREIPSLKPSCEELASGTRFANQYFATASIGIIVFI